MAEGIRKSDLIEDKALEGIKLDLDAMAVSLEKNDKLFTSMAKTLKSEINPTLEKTSKSIREINEQEIKSAKLFDEKVKNEKKLKSVKVAQDKLMQAEIKQRQKLDQTLKGERDEIVKLQELTRRLTKEKRDSFKATLDEGNAYKVLTSRTNKAQSEFKRLSAQYGINSKQAKQAFSSFKTLDDQLRKINNSARDGRRDVGRYGLAWQKARGSLMRVAGALGLVGGGFAIFRKVKDTIVGFDQSMQNLAAITRESTTELEALARELGGSTVFTASEAADAMTMLAMAGFNTNQILAATPATLALASAGQLDLAAAADIASNVLSGFGLEAEETNRVVDVLAATATSTNTTVQTLGESFKEIAPTANNLNIPIEEVAAAIGLLGNSGIKGTDATTVLNSALNRLAKPTKEMKLKMRELNLEFFDSEGRFIGLTNTVAHLNERFQGLTDEQRANAISTIFGARANKQMTSLLLGQTKAMVDGTEQTLKGADALRSLTEEYENAEGSAEQMAKTQEDSVGGAFKLLNSALEEYILGVNEATGFSNGLKNAFTFLAENLNTILGLIGKLITAFVTYKGVILALKMKDRISEWVTFRKEVKKGSLNMADASKSAKGFGQSLKAIGWTIAITGAIELAKAFWDVASGARQARQDAMLLNAVVGKVNEEVQKRLDARQKELDRQLEIANTIKDRVEREKALKSLREDFIKQNEKEAAGLQRNLDKAKAGLELAKKFQKQQAELGSMQGEMQMEFADQLVNAFGGDITDINDIVGEYAAQVAGLEGGLTTLNVSTQEARHQLEVFNKEVEEGTGDLGGNTDATKEQTESVEDLEEAYRNIRTEFEKQAENAGQIANRRNKQLEKETQDIQKNLTKRLTVINNLEAEGILNAEEAAANRIAVELESLEEQRKLLIQYGQDVTDIDLQISQKRLELSKATNNEIVEDTNDTNEIIFEAYQNLQQALTDVLTEQIDSRIDLLKKEADAAKNQQDFLQDLAAQGNITAQQSIAEQIQIQREAEREQARLEKTKQNIQLISSGLKSFNQFLENGDSPTEALAKTFTTTEVLAGFLRNINFFEKGTDNAPKGWAVVDEKGAEIITDKKGNIKDLGTDGGARWKYLQAGDQVKTAKESASILSRFDQIGMGQTVKNAQDKAGNSYDLMILQKELQGMRGDMHKLQTEYKFDFEKFASGIAKFTIEKTKGGDKRTDRYTIR